MKPHRVCMAGIAAATLCLSSCGPSGPAEEPREETLTLYSEAALDGEVVWDTPEIGNSFSGDSLSASANIGDIGNGDNDGFGDGVRRLVVSFSLADLPAGADIQSATLRLRQNGQSSGDSYGSVSGLGAAYVTNISYAAFIPGDELWGASGTGVQVDIGPLASAFAADTWHEIDVTESALAERSTFLSGRLQFRVYHDIENNGDDISDTDGWVTGDAATDRPELVITYR